MEVVGAGAEDVAGAEAGVLVLPGVTVASDEVVDIVNMNRD